MAITSNTNNLHTTAQEQSKPAIARAMPMGAYNLGNTLKATMQDDPWKTHRKHWTDTGKGIFAIEFIARTTLGALMFGLASASASAGKLQDYSLDKKPDGFLQWWARSIDSTFGRSIKWLVTKITGDEQKGINAVTFRPTRNYGTGAPGRSLGAEVVGITFDFTSMSGGSGIVREALYNTLNPTARGKYIKDGKFEMGHFLKRAGLSAGRILFRGMGEDLTPTTSIPYVYFMRLQRNFLDKKFPHFGDDSDRAGNGGSLRIENGKITGDYQLAGMLDLQGRFTVYNYFTIMWQDFLDKIESSYKKWKATGKLPQPHLPNNLGDVVKAPVKYLGKTAFKVLAYMTPSVPFFWIWRSPQSKFKGMIIDPKKGPLAFKSYVKYEPGKKPYLVEASEAGQPGVRQEYHNINADNRYYDFDKHDARYKPWDSKFEKTVYAHDGTPMGTNPVAARWGSNGQKEFFKPYGQHLNAFGTVTDVIGEANYQLVKAGEKVFVPFATTFMGKTSSEAASINQSAGFAALPYAFYFGSKLSNKRKFAGKGMDLAAGQFMDGVCEFNLGKVKAGWGNMWNVLHHRPLSDSVLQDEAERYHFEHLRADDSPLRADAHARYLAWKEQAPSTPEVDKLADAQAYIAQQFKAAKEGSPLSYVQKVKKQETPEMFIPPERQGSQTHEASFVDRVQKSNWQATPRISQSYAAQIEQDGRDQPNLPPGATLH